MVFPLGPVNTTVFLPSGFVGKPFYSSRVPQKYTPSIKMLSALPENKNPLCVNRPWPAECARGTTRARCYFYDTTGFSLVKMKKQSCSRTLQAMEPRGAGYFFESFSTSSPSSSACGARLWDRSAPSSMAVPTAAQLSRSRSTIFDTWSLMVSSSLHRVAMS